LDCRRHAVSLTKSPRNGSIVSAAYRVRLAAGALAVGACLALAACQAAVPLEDYGPAPSYQLTDQTGAAFSSSDIGDRVALVDFIYTRCTDVCPTISPKLQEIQRKVQQDQWLNGRVLLVTMSVDPMHDTPDVMAAYGQQFQADPARWKMLTGDWDAVYATLEGFKVAVRMPRPPVDQPAPGGTELSHTSRVALVDRQGNVRAYFDGVDDSPDEMLAAIRQLAG
jgi:protein SCO1/2